MNLSQAVQKLNDSGLRAFERPNEIRGSLNLTSFEENEFAYIEDSFFVIQDNDQWDLWLSLAQVGIHLIQTSILEHAVDRLIAFRDFIRITKLDSRFAKRLLFDVNQANYTIQSLTASELVITTQAERYILKQENDSWFVIGQMPENFESFTEAATYLSNILLPNENDDEV